MFFCRESTILTRITSVPMMFPLRLRVRTVVAFLSAVLLVGAIAALFFLRSHHTAYVAMDYQNSVTFWRERFASESAKDAYTEFLNDGKTLRTDQTHTLAHIVGAILYDSQGMKGISYCTTDFNYGCYHGFAGRTIEVHGRAGIQMLLDACTEQSILGDCDHGIGHGILAYLGNDNLLEALALCPKPPDKNATGGCYGGVFMEYYLGTLRSDGGTKPLPFDPSVPEGPCRTISEQFRSACYYALPSWWMEVSADQGADHTEQFKSVAKHCEAVTSSTMRQVCFSGAGIQIAGLAAFDAGRVKAWCALMPVDGREACVNESLNLPKGGNVGTPVLTPEP